MLNTSQRIPEATVSITASPLLTNLQLVPLSAYEFVQEITYTPNDTLPALPLSGWIPSVLQAPTSSFQPQTLSVGDSFTLNNSLLSFTITSALDRKNKNAPVSVFPYFNNPFSTACDISTMSLYCPDINLPGVPEESQFSAEIVCNFPATAVTLSWQESIDAGDNFIFRNLVVDLYPNMIVTLAETYSSAAALELGGNITGLILRYNITPSCSNPHKGDPGCLEIWPVDFSSTYTEFTVYDDRGVGQLLDPNFGGGLGSPDAATTNSSFPLPVPILPHMNPPAAQISRSLSNMFQSTFHYLRLELGNIHPNLIYASPDVYNQTISLPVAAGRFAGDVNSYRAQMANETFFFQVLKVVELFNTTARVPVMEYSRTIPRLKPLGSAMTSVFVSTFAMLSTIWTVFSLVAGALATMYSDRRQSKKEEGDLGDDFDVKKQESNNRGRFLNELSTYDAQEKASLTAHIEFLELESRQRFTFLEEQVKQVQLALGKRSEYPELSDDPGTLGTEQAVIDSAV